MKLRYVGPEGQYFPAYGLLPAAGEVYDLPQEPEDGLWEDAGSDAIPEGQHDFYAEGVPFPPLGRSHTEPPSDEEVEQVPQSEHPGESVTDQPSAVGPNVVGTGPAATEETSVAEETPAAEETE